MTHAEYKEMLAPRALDALDGEELRSLDAHLEACAECRTELDALRADAALLAYNVAPVAPSAEVRARILAQVGAEPRADGGTARGAKVDAAAPPTNVVPFARAPGVVRISRPAFLLGSVAASLAIVALSVLLAVLWKRNDELRAELARGAAERRRQEQELARLREDRLLIASPAARVAELAGTEKAERARARLVYDQNTGRAVFVADNLPAAPPGKAYQLWFIADGKPLPGAVFNTDQSGHGETHDLIPPHGRHASVFAVTLEPSGGVAAPTGDKYLLGKSS